MSSAGIFIIDTQHKHINVQQRQLYKHTFEAPKAHILFCSCLFSVILF